MLILPPLWYRVGWDPKRDDFRHFRMDGISRSETVPDRQLRRRHVPFKEDIRLYTEMAK